MRDDRFEDLPVWQAATDLAAEMFGWTDQVWFRWKGDLANRLQRSALSISSIIPLRTRGASATECEARWGLRGLARCQTELR